MRKKGVPGERWDKEGRIIGTELAGSSYAEQEVCVWEREQREQKGEGNEGEEMT